MVKILNCEYGSRKFTKGKFLIVDSFNNLVKVLDHKFDSESDARSIIDNNPKWNNVVIISDEDYSNLWNIRFNSKVVKKKELSNEPFDRIIKILSDYKWISENDINEITKDSKVNKLIFDLGFDSLDIIELVMDIEKEFTISIPNEELDKIEAADMTIDEAIKYLNLK